DRPIIKSQFVSLLGTQVQWLFNRNLICHSGQALNHIAIVISAAYQYVDWTRDELVAMALSEVEELIPDVRGAKLLHRRVIKEPAATIPHTVEPAGISPPAQPRAGTLALAGEWTDTGLPATIESAVISGRRAAEVVRNLNLESGLTAAATVSQGNR